MRTSFISTRKVQNKWQVVQQDLIELTVTAFPNEDYDDEDTAKIAGKILAKMLKISFIEPNVAETAREGRAS